MTSIMRARWDERANPKGIREYPCPTDVTIEVGDLMFWDRRVGQLVARPASDTVLWTGSLAGTQGNLASNFLGVAMSSKVASDGKPAKVRIATKGAFSFPCTSATFEIGDLVAGSRDGSSNFLQDQAVVKIGSPGTVLGALTESMAVGKVTKRYASATELVEFEILGRDTPGGGVRAMLSS